MSVVELQQAPLLETFRAHVALLKASRKRKKLDLQPKTLVDEASAASSSTALALASGNKNDVNTLYCRHESDEFEGDAVLRTLRALLSIVDDRGYQRSPHQLRFHDAFVRATSRVIYRADWQSNKPKIMESNDWTSCPSEILISTPRRFGKTFSIAIFCACLALSCGLEIVVFSPARRASRKLLERIVE